MHRCGPLRKNFTYMYIYLCAVLCRKRLNFSVHRCEPLRTFYMLNRRALENKCITLARLYEMRQHKPNRG